MPMKILIWGYYNRGNFGDDAMGMMFFYHLSNKRHHPVLLTDEKHLKENCASKTTTSLQNNDYYDAVVIGGGGMLNELSPLRRLKHWFSYDELKNIHELNKWLELHECKVIPISVGGGGESFGRIKKRLLNANSKGGSLRLLADMKTLQRMDISGYQHFPDIMWCLPNFFETLPQNSASPVIGWNIKQKDAGPKLIEGISKFNSTFQAQGASVLSHVDTARYPYEYENPEWQRIHYSGDCPGFLTKLSALSVVVSSKLHVGIAALSYGVPFISFNGPPKARIALDEMGLGDMVCTDSYGLFKALEKVMSAPDEARSKVAEVLGREQQAASGHFRRLDELLESPM
jgi:polysaccharide pyruvyl transferase WcaK-like protein